MKALKLPKDEKRFFFSDKYHCNNCLIVKLFELNGVKLLRERTPGSVLAPCIYSYNDFVEIVSSFNLVYEYREILARKNISEAICDAGNFFAWYCSKELSTKEKISLD